MTVVSGVPRSGTSMLMQMLRAGGMPVLADDERPPDLHNPRGYLEYAPVRRLPEAGGWAREAAGRAVKVIHALVPALPEARYRLVLIRRAWPEVLASQAVMLRASGGASGALADERAVAVFEAQLERALAWARARGVPTLVLEHARVLADPEAAAAALDAFLGGGLDRDRMAAAVDPALHRQRGVARV